MTELELDEVRELLIGTWISIALVTEALIESRTLPREELLLMLSQAKEATSDGRRTALAGVQLLMTTVAGSLLDRSRGKLRSRRGGSASRRRSRVGRSLSSRSY